MTTTSRDLNGFSTVITAQASFNIVFPTNTGLYRVDLLGMSNSQAAQWSALGSDNGGVSFHQGGTDYSWNLGVITAAGATTGGSGDANANDSSIKLFANGNLQCSAVQVVMYAAPGNATISYTGHESPSGTNQSCVLVSGSGRARAGAFNAIQIAVAAGTLSATVLVQRLF